VLPIGVVVLNWNGYRDTIACLNSLVQAVPGPRKIVVVDNASTDGSVNQLQRWAVDRRVPHEVAGTATADLPAVAAGDEPLLTLLVANTNRGFAGGNNLGLRYLEQRPAIAHFLLLNNDATVAADFFAELAQALEKVPKIGLLTGTIFEAARPEQIWYAGGRFVPLRALVLHAHEVPASGEPVATEFVSGCAMLISREALQAVGPLAECYFPLYMEDAEYCYRVRAAGLAVVYAPRAKVYHKVGATVGLPSVSPRIAYCTNRHRAFFVRRNLRGWAKLAALSYLGVTKPMRALVETLSGKPAIGWAILRGTIAGFLSAAARH
jgi:GT2 family glycosyltransferase